MTDPKAGKDAIALEPVAAGILPGVESADSAPVLEPVRR